MCVRITNVNDYDLNLYTFDYDLTMAILLANADGTVYHRYAGRDEVSPMNMETLIEVMNEGLATHLAYLERPAPPEVLPPLRVSALVEDLLKGRSNPVYGCYHCHYVREAKQYQAVKSRAWTPDRFWIWPTTKRLGLVMNQKKQYLVDRVIPESPALVSGISEGDELQTLAGRRVLTKYDVQAVLEESSTSDTSLGFTLLRMGNVVSGTLDLADGWKVGDPEDYRWRVGNVYTEHMRSFLPTPGFIGKIPTREKLDDWGLAGGSFALEVSLLNYGTHLAGIRMGDIITGAGGKSDFRNSRDFYHWCEMMRRSNRDLTMELVRQGSPMKLVISSNHLNYANVEESPEVMLGFTPQELGGGGGMRVGLVVDGSSAERAGLKHGDFLDFVDGERLDTSEDMKGILAGKMPGDMLTVKVRRAKEDLLFAYVLVDKEGKKSSLAKLSRKVVEAGQEIDCDVLIKLPENKHIYSVNKEGFGVQTRLDFRGSGYKLLGPVVEPEARRIVQAGYEDMWVLGGEVRLTQRIEVTDAGKFRLLVRAYAQVCDEHNCHEFRAIVVNKGLGKDFSEFRGRFESEPEVN